MRYYYTPVTMSKIRNNDPNAGEDAEKLDCLHVAGETAKGNSHCSKEHFLLKIICKKKKKGKRKYVIVIQPRNCTPGHFSPEKLSLGLTQKPVHNCL